MDAIEGDFPKLKQGGGFQVLRSDPTVNNEPPPEAVKSTSIIFCMVNKIAAF